MQKKAALISGREAYKKDNWQQAYQLLRKADQETVLMAKDLECLAYAAYLTGNETESTDILTRAFNGFLEEKNIAKGIYCAFWLGFILINMHKKAQAGGWFTKAKRLIDEYKPDCAEEGFLIVSQALQQMRGGEAGKAYKLFDQAIRLGIRFNNTDLITLGRLGSGQALILQNKISQGTHLFDEAMVAVISDETSPLITGIVYCAVIDACQKIFDVDRAREWTHALSQWCSRHEELVPYRGQCLVRRAEIMMLNGEWQKALSELQKACQLLTRPPAEPAAGMAYYKHGEIYRLQGDYEQALQLYSLASKLGYKPQPGLALMRFAQGQVDVARAALSQLEKEKKDPVARSLLLPAYAHVMIACNEPDLAQKAVGELSSIAASFNAPLLSAKAQQLQGRLLLLKGDYERALEELKNAIKIFRDLKDVYNAATTRVVLGKVYQQLGDHESARLETEGARWSFEQLGAQPDLKQTEQSGPENKTPFNLTRRELEVMRSLAKGYTNKKIAADLYLSERTIDRHVSNIFSKLGVSSRTAATALAYKLNLV